MGVVGPDVTAVSSPSNAYQRPLQGLHLLYHEVSALPAEYSYIMDAATFDGHLDLVVGLLDAGPIQPEITFDDGHISNLEIAAPALASRGLKAQFFITTGWVGNKAGYMSWPQICELQRMGHQIGAHGWSHKLLTHCTEAQLKHELGGSRKAIEDHLGAPITTMSLPGGRANRRVLDACHAAGYAHVFTSVPRVEAFPLAFTIGRVNVLGSMQAEWVARLFEPDSPELSRLQKKDRTKNVLKAVIGDKLYEKLWAKLNRAQPDPVDEALP